MTTSNLDLEELAKYLRIHVTVLLQGQLAELKPNTKNGKYIINLGNLKNGGTHWVALQFRNNKESVYYDSFGAPPPTKVRAFIPKSCKFAYTNHITQNINSNLCGWFCLGVLTWNTRSTKRSLIESSNDWSNNFSDNSDFNGGRIRMYINHWIPKMPKRLFDTRKFYENKIYT